MAGIGYDILVDMLKYISPTHVVKICISTESKNLPVGVFWLDEDDSTSTTIIEVNSARQDSFKRSYVLFQVYKWIFISVRAWHLLHLVNSKIEIYAVPFC